MSDEDEKWLKIQDEHQMESISLLIEIGLASPADLRNARYAQTMSRQQEENERKSDTLKTKILVVEDDRDIRELIGRFMAKKEYQVVEADNGINAIHQISRHPDIAMVFLDYKMPEMDGLAFLKSIRRQKIIEQIPIVVMSGAANRAVVAQMAGMNISKFLLKPVSSGSIVGCVDELLSKKVS